MLVEAPTPVSKKKNVLLTTAIETQKEEERARFSMRAFLSAVIENAKKDYTHPSGQYVNFGSTSMRGDTLYGKACYR